MLSCYITCSIRREEYVASAINFEQGFRIHRQDIETNLMIMINVVVLIINILI